jgi:hypothetical protein
MLYCVRYRLFGSHCYSKKKKANLCFRYNPHVEFSDDCKEMEWSDDILQSNLRQAGILFEDLPVARFQFLPVDRKIQLNFFTNNLTRHHKKTIRTWCSFTSKRRRDFLHWKNIQEKQKKIMGGTGHARLTSYTVSYDSESHWSVLTQMQGSLWPKVRAVKLVKEWRRSMEKGRCVCVCLLMQ